MNRSRASANTHCPRRQTDRAERVPRGCSAFLNSLLLTIVCPAANTNCMHVGFAHPPDLIGFRAGNIGRDSTGSLGAMPHHTISSAAVLMVEICRRLRRSTGATGAGFLEASALDNDAAGEAATGSLFARRTSSDAYKSSSCAVASTKELDALSTKFTTAV